MGRIFSLKKIVVFSLLLVFSFLSIPAATEAVVSVKGYYRKNGTYVAPHYRSDPDGSVSNNWSTKGNVNPYTGEEGTKTYSGYSYTSDSYSSGNSTYVFDNTLLKTSECKDSYGQFVTYNSYSGECECKSGYTLGYGSTCIPFDSYCSEKFGAAAFYDGSQCVCASGYQYDEVSTKCVKQDDICKKEYGRDAFYNQSTQTCSYCSDGFRLQGKLCYPVDGGQTWAVTKYKVRVYTSPKTSIKYRGPLLNKDQVHFILDSKTNKDWVQIDIDGSEFWTKKSNVKILK